MKKKKVFASLVLSMVLLGTTSTYIMGSSELRRTTEDHIHMNSNAKIENNIKQQKNNLLEVKVYRGDAEIRVKICHIFCEHIHMISFAT